MFGKFDKKKIIIFFANLSYIIVIKSNTNTLIYTYTVEKNVKNGNIFYYTFCGVTLMQTPKSMIRGLDRLHFTVRNLLKILVELYGDAVIATK